MLHHIVFFKNSTPPKLLAMHSSVTVDTEYGKFIGMDSKIHTPLRFWGYLFIIGPTTFLLPFLIAMILISTFGNPDNPGLFEFLLSMAIAIPVTICFYYIFIATIYDIYFAPMFGLKRRGIFRVLSKLAPIISMGFNNIKKYKNFHGYTLRMAKDPKLDRDFTVSQGVAINQVLFGLNPVTNGLIYGDHKYLHEQNYLKSDERNRKRIPFYVSLVVVAAIMRIITVLRKPDNIESGIPDSIIAFLAMFFMLFFASVPGILTLRKIRMIHKAYLGR